MSVESAQAFLKMADANKGVKNALQESLKDVDSEENFFTIVKAEGKEAGFEFSKEEWIKASKKQRNSRVLKALRELVDNLSGGGGSAGA